MTPKEFLRKYEDYKAINTKEQTSMALEYLISKHIEPYLKGDDMGKALDRKQVERWYLDKANDKSISASRKNRIFASMRGIIDKAWRWKEIGSEEYQDLNEIIVSVKVPTKSRTERAVWSYSQERELIESIKDPTDKAMFTLFLYLGCRIGEFLGLQWKCLDKERKGIKIEQQVIYERGGALLTSELKTKDSYRFNTLDDDTYDMIEEYENGLGSVSQSEFMFPSPYDRKTPLSRTEFRRRLDKYTKEAKLPKVVPHGIRHSKATLLASVVRTADEVKCAADFLGHSSKMFMDTYVSGGLVSQNDIMRRIKEKNSK